MSTVYRVVVEVCTVVDSEEWAELGDLARSYVRVQASRRLMRGHSPPFTPGSTISLYDAPSLLTDAIRSLRVCDVSFPLDCPWVNLDEVDFSMRPYRLCGDATPSPAAWSGGAGLAVDGDSDDVPAFTVTPLPHASLEGLWESLCYGESETASIAFKRDIVSYVDTAMRFARAGVNTHLISWNRLLLFHGPPGTGKTSLCRALAHKLSIRLSACGYPRACLLDINAHSLFSRWFSESGKQVLHLFDQVHRIAADPACFVCCVMDEVESLAAARTSAMKGNEPSDSIRVVNALLTQIDRLQRHDNILVLSTSNLTDAIDEALLDRADKRVFVGPPGVQARHLILLASVRELMEKGLVPTAERVSIDAQCSSGDAGLWRWCDTVTHGHPSTSSACGVHTAAPGERAALMNEEDADDSSFPSPSQLPQGAAAAAVRQAAISSAAPAGAVGDAAAAASPADVKLSACVSAGYALTSLLQHIAEASAGLNGRTLKKLPFLAYGRCVCFAAGQSGFVSEQVAVPLPRFLEALFDVAREAAREAATTKANP